MIQIEAEAKTNIPAYSRNPGEGLLNPSCIPTPTCKRREGQHEPRGEVDLVAVQCDEPSERRAQRLCLAKQHRAVGWQDAIVVILAQKGVTELPQLDERRALLGCEAARRSVVLPRAAASCGGECGKAPAGIRGPGRAEGS